MSDLVSSRKRRRNVYSCHVKRRQEFSFADPGASLSFSDVDTAICHLRTTFSPEFKFADYFCPPIVLKHQLYSACLNRTSVDHGVEQSVSTGKLRLFRLDLDKTEYALVSSDDYFESVAQQEKRGLLPSQLSVKFHDALKSVKDVSVTRSILQADLNISDSDIGQLLRAGLLTCRDVDSWWISVPHLGQFVKTLTLARRFFIGAVRRKRYHEALLSDLLKLTQPKRAKFSNDYLLHDLIGAGFFRRVETPSGAIVRLSS